MERSLPASHATAALQVMGLPAVSDMSTVVEWVSEEEYSVESQGLFARTFSMEKKTLMTRSERDEETRRMRDVFEAPEEP